MMTRDYIPKHLGAAAAQQIFKSIPPDAKAVIDSLQPHEFYPIEYWNHLVRGIVGLYPDPQRAYTAMIECGRGVASESINSFLRLLVKFLNPKLFARKHHDIFRKDHNFGELTVDASDIDNRHYTLHMKGTQGYLYVAPVSMGWMYMTLETMGCRGVKIREVLSPPPATQDADEYRYEISWDS